MDWLDSDSESCKIIELGITGGWVCMRVTSRKRETRREAKANQPGLIFTLQI